MHPIENIMRTTMEQLKAMVDVNTIVGDPLIANDGTMILPVSKVCTGFVSGGGEYNKGECIKKSKEDLEVIDDFRHPFAGASAAGVSLTPVAFVVVGDGSVKVLPAQSCCTIDRMLELLPRLVESVENLACKCKQTPPPQPTPQPQPQPQPVQPIQPILSQP